MATQVIYMMNSHGADPAILKGLVEAGCDVRDTYSVAETFNSFRNTYSRSADRNLMLVAEVQAGAIPLLTLLHETYVNLPPTLLFDQEGNNLQPAIKALRLGVRDYILASEPAVQRELRARVLAERTMTVAKKNKQPIRTASATFSLQPIPILPAHIVKPRADTPIPMGYRIARDLHSEHLPAPLAGGGPYLQSSCSPGATTSSRRRSCSKQA